MSHSTPPSTDLPSSATSQPEVHGHAWYCRCLHNLWHHLPHHLCVALAVACLVGLLNLAGYLGWLEAGMLRLTVASTQVLSEPADPKHTQQVEGPHMPEVLLISEGLYAERFKLSSPLDREALARLLTQLFNLGTQQQVVPEVLVFDIDLSDNGHEKQKALDDVLKLLVDGGTRLVLPMPLPTSLPELQQAKRAWMEKVCQWEAVPPKKDSLPAQPRRAQHVRFASAQVDTHGGQVLQYNRQLNTLGTMAGPRADRSPDGCSLSSGVKAVHLASLTQPHAEPLALPGDANFKPYQQQFFAMAYRHVHRLGRDGTLPLTQGAPVNLQDKVVFIGGDYDSRDRLLSPWSGTDNALPGVLAHAAAYYSEQRPLKAIHAFDFVLDVVVGVVAGYLFHGLWHCYRMHDLPWRTKTRMGYLRAKGLFLLIPGTALLAAFGLVWLAAHCFYPAGHWVNPGPMVLGVALKVLLSSGRERHHSKPVLALQVGALVALLAFGLPKILFH